TAPQLGHGLPDRGHGSRGLLQGAPCEQQGAEPYDHSGYPGVIVRRPEREPAEAERQQRSPQRQGGPPAEPNQLLPASVLLHSHEQPGGAEQAAPDLEIPASVPAPMYHARAVRPDRRLHPAPSLLLLLPAL